MEGGRTPANPVLAVFSVKMDNVETHAGSPKGRASLRRVQIPPEFGQGETWSGPGLAEA